MSKHRSSATWHGSLKEGNGKMNVGEGAWEGKYSAKTRFEAEGDGTSPEELIAAAHAGCFSMAFSMLLTNEGHEPEKIETKAEASIEKVDQGFKITKIHLNTNGYVKGIEEDKFQELAEAAKENCPVSQALKQGVKITMEATLNK